MTAERLAFESDTAKGYLSDIEHGLARPTVAAITKLAEALDVLLLDVVTAPDADDRQRLIDASRHVEPAVHRKLLDILARESQE